MKNINPTLRPSKTADQDETTGPATHAEIASRARELWNEYGQPAGQDQEIWLEAERQMRDRGLAEQKWAMKRDRAEAEAAFTSYRT